MSIVPVAIAGGIWYHLAKQGLTTQTIWLGCNLLDTLRALRLVRPNGRAVGQRTRRKAMHEALTCWITYVVVQYLGSVPDRLLGWLPVYSLLRTAVVSCFLLARVSTSETIYNSLIQPTIRKYQMPIDLSLELGTSLVMLVYHFTLEYPLHQLRALMSPYTAKITSLCSSITGHSVITASSSTPAEDPTDTTETQTDVVPGSSLRAAVTSTPKPSNETCEKQSPVRPTYDEMVPPLPRSVTRLRPSHSKAAQPRQPRAPRQLPVEPVPRDSLDKGPTTVTAHQDPFTKPPSTRVRTMASDIDRSEKPEPIKARVPIQQAAKRAGPVNRNTNLPRADPPLVKAKSVSQLKPSKPLATATETLTKRPYKSSPIRRPVAKISAHDDPSSARVKRLASAAERAKEIRERKRREPGVTPGEKRGRGPTPLRSDDVPGSKRTKFTVARD